MFERLRKTFSGKPAEDSPAPVETDMPEMDMNDQPARGPAGYEPAPRFDVEHEDDHPLRPAIVAALRQVYDPEIPVDIFEMGLIYSVTIGADGAVRVAMTLTSPNCPVAEILPLDVEKRVSAVAGVGSCTVEIVWDPTWHPDMISEAGKLDLGMM